MEGGCSLLLQFLAEIIWQKEIMDVTLVAKRILVMRTDGCIEVILNLRSV